jgi:Fe-S cluster assembly protein SufD
MEDKNSFTSLDICNRIVGLADPGLLSVGNKKLDSLRKKANEEIIAANPKELIDVFGKKHSEYLSGIEKLTIPDSVSITINEDPGEHKSKIAGKKVIGKLKIFNDKLYCWIDHETQEKGVILCDLLTAFKDHSEITKHIFAKKGINRNTILSNLVIAQAGLGSFLYVPDDVQLDGVFMIETDIDAYPSSLYLIHLITMIGKSAAGNLIVDIRSKNIEDNQSIFVIQNEVILDDNSRLTIFQKQRVSDNSALFISEQIFEGRNAFVNDCILDQGGALLDRFIAVETENEGGEAKITALYDPKNSQRFFYDTHQKHNFSHTVSDLLFKGVLGKDVYSIWKGNIFVAKGTNGANGYQANNILLVDESAKAESIPGLEILTDDVRCSHGVTMGNIDKNQMFYLQCRGINKQDAEKLIVDGFLFSAVKRIDDKDFEKYIQTSLEN